MIRFVEYAEWCSERADKDKREKATEERVYAEMRARQAAPSRPGKQGQGVGVHKEMKEAVRASLRALVWKEAMDPMKTYSLSLASSSLGIGSSEKH